MAGKPFSVAESTLILYFYRLSERPGANKEKTLRQCKKTLKALAVCCGRSCSDNYRNTGVLFTQFALVAAIVSGGTDCRKSAELYRELLAAEHRQPRLLMALAADILCLLTAQEEGAEAKETQDITLAEGMLIMHFYKLGAEGLLNFDEALSQGFAALRSLTGRWREAAGQKEMERCWALLKAEEKAALPAPFNELSDLHFAFPRLFYGYLETFLELANGPKAPRI